jgi:hypothetical protein
MLDKCFPNAQEPILYFELADIADYWEELSGFLSVNSFQSGKEFVYKIVKFELSSFR